MSTEKVDAIVQRLGTACVAYYGPGDDLMTDAAFDALEAELRCLDPAHPFLSRTGDADSAAPKSNSGSTWPKAKHKQPMDSLNKATNEAEWLAWLTRVNWNGEDLIFSEKLDGASLSLEFRAGKLVQAITRGRDGIVGDDITANACLMQGIPSYIPFFDGLVRGEVVCTRSDFGTYFSAQSNPRNTANGVMKRRSDGAECRHLTFVAFKLLTEDRALRPTSKEKEFEDLKDLGFKIPYYRVGGPGHFTNMLFEYQAGSARAAANYDIDGLVVQFNDPDVMDALGSQGRGPKGAIARKFTAQAAETTLREIIWQVGKSGRITPVALFAAVDLGVQVHRATLHNAANVQQLWGEANVPAAGDRILVSRRGDVIPCVESVISIMGQGTAFHAPTNCPGCGSILIMDGAHLFCRSADCSAQIAGAVRRWVQKIGVLHFGNRLIEALIDGGRVEDIADLYTVHVEDAESLHDANDRRIGRTATKGFKALHAKKTLPLHVILGSLGIPLVGRSTARTILEGCGAETWEAAYGLSVSQISRVDAIGAGRAESFVAGLATHAPLLSRLLAQSITVLPPARGSLKGQTFCLSGVRDAELAAAMEAQGATQKGSVSKNLTLLICKDPDSTSGKPEKARKYGVTIRSLEDARANYLP